MSSKRKVRRKMCEGKKRHATYANARVAMYNTPGSGMQVYKCQFCGCFHVGHMCAKQRRLISGEKLWGG